LSVKNDKILNFNIYINSVILLLINPIKIFYFKIYKVLWIWKNSQIHNLILVRMVGLILSILIFTGVINYIRFTLNINILIFINNKYFMWINWNKK